MDADDLFVEDVEDILNTSVDRKEDILFFNYKTVLSNDLKKMGSRGGYQLYFDEHRTYNNEYKFRYHFDSIWGKVIKRTLIEKFHIRCDETRYGNDVGFSFKCGLYAKDIAIIDRVFFVITERDGSLASSQFNGKKKSVEEYTSRLEGALKIRKLINEKKIPIKNRMYVDLSFDFVTDYPYSFYKYYFFSMLKSYTRIAITLPLYLCYLKFFKGWMARIYR